MQGCRNEGIDNQSWVLHGSTVGHEWDFKNSYQFSAPGYTRAWAHRGGFQTLPDLLCFHMITPVNVRSLAALQRLDANKQAWAQVSCKERAHMLRECARRVPELARSLAEVATTAKGAGPTGLGDEW